VNSVGFLSGTLTIAGQPFSVSQDASSCGGTDVSSQVTVSIQALLSPYYTGPYTQQLRLTNQGAAVAGPLYMVFYGLCSTTGPSFCPISSQYFSVQCQGPDSNYSPAVFISFERTGGRTDDLF